MKLQLAKPSFVNMSAPLAEMPHLFSQIAAPFVQHHRAYVAQWGGGIANDHRVWDAFAPAWIGRPSHAESVLSTNSKATPGSHFPRSNSSDSSRLSVPTKRSSRLICMAESSNTTVQKSLKAGNVFQVSLLDPATPSPFT